MNCWEVCCVTSRGLEIIVFCYWFLVWFPYGLCRISVLLSWLKFVLWYRKCTVFPAFLTIPWALKKNVSSVIERSFLHMSVRSVLFISSTFFLMFCLAVLWQHTLVFLSGKSHGQRSLAIIHRVAESEMTEWLNSNYCWKWGVYTVKSPARCGGASFRGVSGWGGQSGLAVSASRRTLLDTSVWVGHVTHPPYQLCLICYRRLSVLSHFSCVQLFTTLWTVACQTLLSMGVSKQEYWNGLPCPPPGDLPDPRVEPVSLRSPASAGVFTPSTTWVG